MLWRAFSFPQYELFSKPTPMEEVRRLSSDLGVKLFIKRDDVMELALGGNKVRKLEFIVGHALSKGYDTLVTCGAMHSNHARLTAAAARKAGLDVHLVLSPPGDREVQGNILLEKLLNAEITYVESRDEVEKVMNEVAERLRGEGRKPLIIPGGGACPHGVLGYVTASLEIMQQLSKAKVRPDYIVHATGTGTTQAGLILGLKLLGADVKVIGISVGRTKEEVGERVRKLINEACDLLGAKVSLRPDDVVVLDQYTLGGYGVITKEVVDTMKYVALKEGLILDPVYTAKAMYGLMRLVENGEVEKGSSIVFIHTGGTPIPFQKAGEVVKYL